MSIEERVARLERSESLYRKLAMLLVLALAAGVSMASTTAETDWEFHSAPFGQQSFYAIKFNRTTGESWILSAEKGAQNDKWLRLPSEDKTERNP
jgi:hypothetical protein